MECGGGGGGGGGGGDSLQVYKALKGNLSLLQLAAEAATQLNRYMYFIMYIYMKASNLIL